MLLPGINSLLHDNGIIHIPEHDAVYAFSKIKCVIIMTSQDIGLIGRDKRSIITPPAFAGIIGLRQEGPVAGALHEHGFSFPIHRIPAGPAVVVSGRRVNDRYIILPTRRRQFNGLVVFSRTAGCVTGNFFWNAV